MSNAPRAGRGAGSPPSGRSLRRGRPVRTRPEDGYVDRHKNADSLVCERCGVVRHQGRWTWGAPPVGPVLPTTCPACARAADRVPAGRIRLDSRALPERETIERIARNVEEAERGEHPLERLMGIEVGADGIELTTTGTHLARRIAGRVARAFHRRPRITYRDDPRQVEIVFGPEA